MEADSMARTTVKQTPASDSLSLRPTNGAVGLKLHWLPKHSSKVTSFCQSCFFVPWITPQRPLVSLPRRRVWDCGYDEGGSCLIYAINALGLIRPNIVTNQRSPHLLSPLRHVAKRTRGLDGPFPPPPPLRHGGRRRRRRGAERGPDLHDRGALTPLSTDWVARMDPGVLAPFRGGISVPPPLYPIYFVSQSQYGQSLH